MVKNVQEGHGEGQDRFMSNDVIGGQSGQIRSIEVKWDLSEVKVWDQGNKLWW